MADSLRKVGEVIIVAPDREQSAVGAGITLHQPIRLSEVNPYIPGIKAYAVEGTPSDSIIVALRLLLKDPVDIVFCGINEGANLGDDVILSGTVGAAMQGHFQGLPAVALSVELGKKMHFEVAAQVAAQLAPRLVNTRSTSTTFLNINIPNKPISSIKGIEITRLARRQYQDVLTEGYVGKRKYYWITRGTPQWNDICGTDVGAMRNSNISITPLYSDLTDTSHQHIYASYIQGLFEDLTRSHE